MTMLHAGGKFGGGSYKVSGGLHGVGVSAVNALSEWCEVVVWRDGKTHFQRYERGYPSGPVEVKGKAPTKTTGTKTTFRFDPEIFKGAITYRFDTLVQRFREMAFVTRGVTIFLLDERSNREMTFYFEGGIISFVRYLNRNRQVLHPVVHVEREIDGIAIDAAIQYTGAYAESVYAFANTINTVINRRKFEFFIPISPLIDHCVSISRFLSRLAFAASNSAFFSFSLATISAGAFVRKASLVSFFSTLLKSDAAFSNRLVRRSISFCTSIRPARGI